jgi:hypothetical protein
MAEAKQLKEEDTRWTVYQVRAYDEFLREVAVHRVKIELD